MPSRGRHRTHHGAASQIRHNHEVRGDLRSDLSHASVATGGRVLVALLSTMTVSCPPRGVYVPAVAFFHEDETLDFAAFEAHLTRMSKAGVAGLVIQGSNGEAMHMSHAERQDVLRLARRVLDEHGRPGAVIIAGCGAQSTRETVLLCHEAKEAGADFALVLAPSYWGESDLPCPLLGCAPGVASSD